MSGKTIRVFVLLALCAITGIVLVQAYWFGKAFDNAERAFENNLNIALNETVKGVLHYNNTLTAPAEPVRQIAPDYYAVMVNDRINADVLEHYLRATFSRFHISQSFEYRIFDCASEHLVYGGYVEGSDSSGSLQPRELPAWKGDNYYFTVYFPHKTSGVIGGMSPWLFSSAVVLLVVIFFCYSLFVILRQKRLSEVQRDFINNMTHEIKTPVSVISISAETLRNPAIVHQPQRLVNYANIILAEAARLQEQVERVLQVADHERPAMSRKPVDMHELISESLERIAEHTAHKQVHVTYTPQAAHAVVSGDALHLSNALLNLFDNAVKYSKGELQLQVHTENPAEGKLLVRITDNGIGIPKALQQRVFDRFYRVPSGNIHNVKGFGIGLSYVRQVARAHGGNIAVKSTEGGGSSFLLTLPVA